MTNIFTFHFRWGHTSPTRDQTCAPLHWKHGVLTTGPPGKSLEFLFFLRQVVIICCSSKRQLMTGLQEEEEEEARTSASCSPTRDRGAPGMCLKGPPTHR